MPTSEYNGSDKLIHYVLLLSHQFIKELRRKKSSTENFTRAAGLPELPDTQQDLYGNGTADGEFPHSAATGFAVLASAGNRQVAGPEPRKDAAWCQLWP